MAAVTEVPSSGVVDEGAMQLSECLLVKSVDQCLYEEMSFEATRSQYPHFKHAAHCMIYAYDNRVLWDQYRVIANIMVRIE